MQTSENCGIIIYRDSRLPKVLSAFSMPSIRQQLSISLEDCTCSIFLFDCPINTDKLDKKRYRHLSQLVNQNKIKFLVERFEAKVHSNVSKKKNELHYSDIMSEMQAMKQLAVLLKKSQDIKENLLKKNVGFIMGELDKSKIDLLSEETGCLMIYENPSMSEQVKRMLHHELMEKKGVSVVFTKDIEKIIYDSDILSIDEKVDLLPYIKELGGKIILGKGNHEDIRGIYDITLWYQDLRKEAVGNEIAELNDEILCIMRYFYRKLDIIEFIKKLPYIYF